MNIKKNRSGGICKRSNLTVKVFWIDYFSFFPLYFSDLIFFIAKPSYTFIILNIIVYVKIKIINALIYVIGTCIIITTYNNKNHVGYYAYALSVFVYDPNSHYAIVRRIFYVGTKM